MNMDLVPLFSGSSGNCTFLRTDSTSLLIDAGLSGSRITKELEKVQVAPNSINGILITHEHVDHSAGVGILSRRYGIPVYATAGTWDAMASKIGKIDPKNHCIIHPEQDFYINDLSITPFSIPHDAAEPVGYAFFSKGLRCAIATDIGHMTTSILDHMAGSQLVMLESNHDIEMLHACGYPYELKRRILSARGHLSNEAAGDAIIELAHQEVTRFLLAHLSKDANFPSLAWQTVNQALEQHSIEPQILDVLNRDCVSSVYHLYS